MELGITRKEKINISIIRDGQKSGDDEYPTSQHVSMLKGLLRLYASTYTGSLACTLYHTESTPVMIWVYSSDWGVVMDKVVYSSYSSPFWVSPYLVGWLTRQCREIHLHFGRIPIESFLPNFLVNADSNIEVLGGLRLTEEEIERFSTILQQSSKVKELDMIMHHFHPCYLTKLVKVLCRCSRLKSVSIRSRKFGSIDFQDWMDNVLSLIRCGHLEEIHFGFDMAHSADTTFQPEHTQMILDAIEGNQNLVKLEFPNEYYACTRGFIDCKKIESAMESRMDSSS